ncbi:MFS transporter [Rhodoplanes sp. TEM]|uniref:MFS transporter n=1 Tax=Rhodoplanes tepidamans TaxID=200616 RepID=A0ABT5JEY5_RHOTP|nr:MULTISPECIES: MFS transporter [Rhodoplanes]MDC7788260.1 MFS transporter [Rhodoplanes tepidamans]MDC7982935.1 MFS transporter [Rhodoplanes sp. TEM]MDQ0355871.1 CP family cyanate transporter-like MFS transporter [Rhodoplanes tepidamans]
MRAPAVDGDTPGLRHLVTALALLWLAGTGLRMTILSVPPVIPMIRDDLGMSATDIGILTGIPSVLFALAAIPGSLLIAKFGALKTLLIGLLATAAGSALRGVAPDVWLLYGATVVTGFGVAVMQPSLPPLVRTWLPDRIPFGTAVYANGLLVGEVLPVALTLPVLVPLLGGWRASFFAWAVPCVAIALVVAVLAPRGAGGAAAVVTGRKWWPDWSSGLLWRIGIMFGTVNAQYFTTNAFIPDVLTRTGRPDLISLTLTALNLGQIPASLLLLVFAGRLVRKVWPYVAAGLVSFVALLGLMYGSPTVIVISSVLIGLCDASVLILIFALPSILAPPEDVHRLAAGMFTISYSCAVITPVLSGLAWDLSGEPLAAFVPILIGALLLAVLAPSVTGIRHHAEEGS